MPFLGPGVRHIQKQRFDPITGMPNCAAFMMDYRPRPTDHIVVVALCDPNRFDELLRAVGGECAEDFVRLGARRVAEAASDEAKVYHLGGAKFALLSPAGALPDLLQRLGAKFEDPIFCGDVPIGVDIAVGVANCRELDASAAVRAATAAARDCRDNGGAWACYDQAADAEQRRKFLLFAHLPSAIKASDQLHLHYQPKRDMLADRTTGVEALLRWRHPILGDIPPSDFIPSAEAAGRIHLITEWVLRNAIAQIATWAADGLWLTVAINVSPRDLARRGFSAQVVGALKEFGVPPARIELEFTEGVMFNKDPVILSEARALRASGVRISLDDFGTGFANFSHIVNLPADAVKIDKSLIGGISTNNRSITLVRSIINMAHEMGYTVVAEGIESEAEYNMLRSMGCDEGQGYYISKPVAPDDIPRKLALEMRAGADDGDGDALLV